MDVSKNRVKIMLVYPVQMHMQHVIANRSFQLIAGPFLYYFALIYDRNFISQLFCFFKVLGGKQNSGPSASQITNDGPHAVAAPRIESGCGFIQKKYAGYFYNAGSNIQSS